GTSIRCVSPLLVLASMGRRVDQGLLTPAADPPFHPNEGRPAAGGHSSAVAATLAVATTKPTAKPATNPSRYSRRMRSVSPSRCLTETVPPLRCATYCHTS